jgi:hypothetical protein
VGDDQLNLEVKPAARLENGLHLEALMTDEAAKVLLHPLLLLAPRSMTMQTLVRGSGGLVVTPSPRSCSKIPFSRGDHTSLRGGEAPSPLGFPPG